MTLSTLKRLPGARNRGRFEMARSISYTRGEISFHEGAAQYKEALQFDPANKEIKDNYTSFQELVKQIRQRQPPTGVDSDPNAAAAAPSAPGSVPASGATPAPSPAPGSTPAATPTSTAAPAPGATPDAP